MWLVDASNFINITAVLDGLRSPFSHQCTEIRLTPMRRPNSVLPMPIMDRK